MRLAEREGVVEERALDLALQRGERRRGRLHAHRRLRSRVAAHDRHLGRVEVTRADLHADRDAAELGVGELVPRPEIVAIVDLDAEAGVSPALREPLRLAQHPTPLVVVPEDRDDDHLDRGDAGRQPQPLRVAVEAIR